MRESLTKPGKTLRVASPLILLFFLLVPLISAAPSEEEFGNYQSFGLALGYKVTGPIEQGKLYQLNVHVFNASTGAPLSNTTVHCAMHLYNQSGQHIFVNNNISFLPVYDFSQDIVGGNLSTPGVYPYVIACFTNDFSGGAVYTDYLEVTSFGNLIENSSTFFLILFLCSLAVLALAIAMQNEYIGFLAGALFIITGIYTMIYGVAGLSNMYTRSISFVLIGLGLIFEVAAGYKAITENNSSS